MERKRTLIRAAAPVRQCTVDDPGAQTLPLVEGRYQLYRALRKRVER